jgi:pyruvate, water dikinase
MPVGTSNHRSATGAVVPFEQLPGDAVAAAGGKGASLARIATAGFPVPAGFVVCAQALQSFLDGEGAALIQGLVAGVDIQDQISLQKISTTICEWICNRAVPAGIEEEIHRAYSQLGRATENLLVAVRSSGVSEDSETASFAGQQETYLNVSGSANVVRKVRDCWASFFSPRALFYRGTKGSLTDTSMAVVVQEMVQADRSGVMFTVDPIQKRREYMVIEAVFGLGEGIVSGAITPDHLVIDRQNGSIVEEFVAFKATSVSWNSATGATCESELPEEKTNARVLDDADLSALCTLGLRLEEHFGKPQDVEWCIRDGQVFVLQSRPITVL